MDRIVLEDDISRNNKKKFQKAMYLKYTGWNRVICAGRHKVEAQTESESSLTQK